MVATPDESFGLMVRITRSNLGTPGNVRGCSHLGAHRFRSNHRSSLLGASVQSRWRLLTRSCGASTIEHAYVQVTEFHDHPTCLYTPFHQHFYLIYRPVRTRRGRRNLAQGPLGPPDMTLNLRSRLDC
jgi:hypothetical protein